MQSSSTSTCNMQRPAYVIHYEMGEIVQFNERQCLISGIANTLGYDRYSLIDLENGQLHYASHFQLDQVAMVDLVLGDADIMEGDTCRPTS